MSNENEQSKKSLGEATDKLDERHFDSTVSLLEAIYERYADLSDLNGVHSYRMAYNMHHQTVDVTSPAGSILQRLTPTKPSNKEQEEDKLSQSFGGIKINNHVSDEKTLNNSYPPANNSSLASSSSLNNQKSNVSQQQIGTSPKSKQTCMY
jgi:hypothetical protein